MKKVKLYFITPYTEDRNESLKQPYTVVSDMRQARTYINMRVFLENQEHFKMWCDLHNKNFNDLNTFYNYIDIRYGDDSPYNKYDVIPVVYKVNDLCGMLRTIAGVEPLGLYYESDIEKEYFNKQNGV